MAQTVTVIFNSDAPSTRFQVVPVDQQNGDSAPAAVFTSPIRGNVTSWLACNGYKWLEGSQPEQWVKA